jgi:hypothetical protein
MEQILNPVLYVWSIQCSHIVFRQHINITYSIGLQSFFIAAQGGDVRRGGFP